MTNIAPPEATTQKKVNDVWGGVWGKDDISAENIFKQRLFIEGYPTFKKFLPLDTKKFLEVGAGSGRYGLKVAMDIPGVEVTLTDIIDTSLRSMEKTRAALGLTNVTIRKEDVLALSFANDYFDVVLCDAVIQHLGDVSSAMSEMRRVLKPGGIMIVSTMNVWNFHSLYKLSLRLLGKEYNYGYEKSYTPFGLRQLFRAHELEVVATDGFYPAYGVYRLKKYWRPWALIGRVLNRANSIIDPLTGRFFSRFFGFEIFCVGRK